MTEDPLPRRTGPPRRLGRPVGALVVVLAAGLVMLTVLSGGGAELTAADSPDASPASAPGDPILGFFQCLRDGGLDVADPSPGGPIGLRGVDMDDPRTATVVQQCAQEWMADSDGRVTVGDGAFGDNMASPQNLLAFVDCIRGHGFDMADPDPDGLLSVPGGVDPQSPEFQAASQECSAHLDGGGIRIGSPGGDGPRGVMRGPSQP